MAQPTMAPSVPGSLLDGWEQTENSSQRLFDVGFVRVTANTVVYEDAATRAAVRDRTGVDSLWRFLFLSRLELRPAPKSAGGPVYDLVVRKARSGFADQLRERGFENVSVVDTYRRTLGGERARVVEYDAICRADGARLAVRGWLTVRPDDGQFLLGGGAYPTAVVDVDREDLAGVLEERIDPPSHREELFELLDAVS